MSKEHRTRPDGSTIDPVKSLADYVQSFPQTGEPDPAPVVAKPAAPPTVPAPPAAAPEPTAPIADPEFAGKSSEEIIALAKKERERSADLERREREARAELQGHQTQRQIEDTARRVLAEQQAPRAPEAPREDPRWQQVDDLWFTEPAKSRALMKQIQDDEYGKRLEADRARTKQEVFTELTEKQQREQGNYAFNTAMQKLKDSGQPIDTNRVTAVYTVITRPPTKDAPNQYYLDGGPLNADVIVKAWGDLFGTHAAPAAPTIPIAAAPIPVAPPGSGRPAPAAAAPARTRAIPIDANTRKEYEMVAKANNLDPEKMIARRRARLEREGHE